MPENECTSDRAQYRRPRRKAKQILDDSKLDPANEILDSAPEEWSISTSIPQYHSISPSVSHGDRPGRHDFVLGFEELGPQEALSIIVQDYVHLLFPLIPVVHLPSFQTDVVNNRADSDTVFRSLLLGICTLVVCQLPRRFLDYKNEQWFSTFSSPYDFALHSEKFINSYRLPDYFESASVEKCAIAYLLAMSFYHVGLSGRATLYWGEVSLFLSFLGADEPRSYSAVNLIEAQLRKKLFWLYVIGKVHQRLDRPDEGVENSNWAPLPDHMLFNSDDLAALMPLEVDDEYLFSDHIVPQPPDHVSLVAGFNCAVKVFLGFVDLPLEELGSPSRSRGVIDTLRKMYQRTIHLLDDVPPQLSGWRTGYVHGAESPNGHDPSNNLRHRQLESLRANIHVTSLWARSRIFERLHGLTSTSTTDDSEFYRIQHNLWSERQYSCERLLHVLYNIRQQNLEPNGRSLLFKIRQVAAPLLNCAFEDHTTISPRARIYIERFVELLAQLDKYSFHDTQIVVWRNLESQRRHPVQELVGDRA
ncbi:hypothetical protein PV08_06766 [Exophiala spinifera]|uniref:Transcription factor domain-containing protein n=1 Tax=Exophiala spinifera TaxID=91928 RepID=A0A0D2B5N7_9EURO|nr:uncharacterized protein PV08_06766 [Exophiala spinifera]KIW13985.1 hypothetical protein PV08_06766 [Exophiala spinifera]